MYLSFMFVASTEVSCCPVTLIKSFNWHYGTRMVIFAYLDHNDYIIHTAYPYADDYFVIIILCQYYVGA